MTALVLDRAGPVELALSAPPSKSLTHRALVAATLALWGVQTSRVKAAPGIPRRLR